MSILKGMSKAEEGQRRVLFAMDILARTAKEYKLQLQSMQESKDDEVNQELKRKAREQAEAEAKAIREKDSD